MAFEPQVTQTPPRHTLPAGMQAYMQMQVKVALAEDVGSGDLTAQLLPESQHMTAHIISREHAVICGIDWANTCFKAVDQTTEILWQIDEGTTVGPNQLICKISGNARALLTAERCALNFLQTLSATATETAKYVKAVAGTKARILDTRKTIPSFRLAQKYAVKVGGGDNQRLALYDGILIKENHIAAAGSIEKVLQLAFALNTNKVIQIEVETLTQLQEALNAGAENILLDNFSPQLLNQAVAINSAFAQPAVLEASGGITLANVRSIALTGVDRISVGGLTKNIQAIDLSMRIL